MHIGNARVALVNYLFARQQGGEFIFRIDDTDRERSRREYEKSIIDDIAWLKITYDETFRQSERTSRYDEVRDDLIARGVLYECYESQEELEYKRKAAIATGKPPVYDRASLQLPARQIEELRATGMEPYLRFKLPNKVVTWSDIVLGNISYDLTSVSDPVIRKADGTYLYSFSSVVDDIDSGITHIIRGQDHVTNTAVQIAMFDEISAGRYKVNFAHLSLMVNKDGSQFSKRIGGLNLGDFRMAGIDQMAISSLLATLGTSLDTKPFQAMEDLIKCFDITKFGTNSPKFDSNDVLKLNRKIMRLKEYNDVKEYISSSKAFEVVRENIDTYNDLRLWNEIFATGYTPVYTPLSPFEVAILEAARNVLHDGGDNLVWTGFVDTVGRKAGIAGRNLYMPLRMATTGLEHGPNIANLFEALGINEVKHRVESALMRASQVPSPTSQ
jgi:glutamyl-tRNA synthetase